jgi:Protein of unknown function (DUF3500)
MKLSRMLLALMVMAGLAGVAYVRQANEPAGSKMTNAADKLLASLTADQKAKATFDFDDKERLNWDFVPLQDAKKKSTRKGIPLEEMTAEQKAAAQALLAAGTSSDGYAKATTIMSLEAILHELEKGGRMVRNPEWYFFTIFGTPSKTGKWGWRVEGHHLSLNFAVDGGKVIAATPAFFGANPASVMQEPRKGLRTLPEADDLAGELFKSLDENQKKAAYQEKEFPEIKSHTTKDPQVGAPRGLAAAKMTPKQRGLLLKLLQAYATRMPSDVAEVEMSEVNKAGVEQIFFAYNGGVEPGKKHTYWVQGPTFVIQFLNVQDDSARNPANHIHSVWRNTKGDFGLTQ